ncbi:MAG: hypothetical protein AUI47_12550 [Acidobacteria bacterium 13_1_40CM_2_68_5]|nr:MAG: hypothetical protein AUI47_12550 [Acidobacteria bacterium 13_1_40CM_2_68_5]
MVSNCGRAPVLRCDVDVAQPERGLIAVKCAASGAPKGSSSIKQMVPDGILRVHDFKAETPEGAGLEVTGQHDAAMGSKSRRFTERIVHSDDRGLFIYKYEVEPGAWMDESMQPRGGQRFGHLDDHGGLLSGRNLFLLPSWYNLLSRIDVEFHLPDRWRVVGTLPQSDAGVRLAGAGTAARALVNSVIGLGEFEEASARHGRDTLRFYASLNLPGTTRQAAFRVAREGFAYLEDRLGPLGHDYSVVLSARPDDGSLILIHPSEGGQGGELAGAAPVQMYDLLFSLGRAYTALSPSAFRFAGADQWLTEALPVYYAIRAEEATGVRPGRVSWRLRAYSAASTRAFLRSFARDGEAGQEVARAKGSHVLAIAETLLASAGNGAAALDGVVRLLREAEGRRQFLDLLAEAAPRTDLSVLHQLVATHGPVPDEWIAKEATRPPLRLTSVPESGGSVVAERHLKLLVTANTTGMLEVCGCKARQLGGIARRETIRRRARSRGDAPLLVDLGNAYANPPDDPILDPSEQRELDLALELMGRQEYSVAAVGHAEMLRGPFYFRELAGRRPLPYINGNLTLGGRSLAPAFRLTRTRGLRVAWLSVLDPANYNIQHARYYEENLGDLSVAAPLESLARTARQVRSQADLVIAIGSLAPDLVRDALETVPEIDAYLSTESVEAVFNHAFSFEGDTESAVMGFHGPRLVFFSSGEGKELEELDLGLGPRGGVRSVGLTRHQLGEDVPDDPRFRDRLAAFYDGIKQSPELAGSEEPAARVLPSLLKEAVYTGTATCRPCHRDEFEDWQAQPHGFAFSVLLARHRNYAPRCVSCHVTGYGLPSGYRIGDPLERLRHVGCEMCHGPGSAHVAAPSSANIIRRPPREACFECHTPDHSDMTAENFDSYYERATHKDLFSSPPEDQP